MKRNRMKPVLGERFGRLVVVAEAGFRDLPSGRRRCVQCLCDCGGTATVYLTSIRSGRTSSCGCLWLEKGKLDTRRHGRSRSAAYFVWQGMKARCLRAPRYKGRGIKVCERWADAHGFESFLADMGERPSPKHSIERIDNDGNYEPANCRWATKVEQGRNTRRNHFITINGEKKCVSEWSAKFGIPVQTLLRRVKLGWPVAALSKPPKPMKRPLQTGVC